MKINTAVTQFKDGLSVLFGKIEAGSGNRKLAKMSKIVMPQISIAGKHEVRKLLIKSVESDFNKVSKKGEAEIDRILEEALNTPEYMKLLKMLDLNDTHIRAQAIFAKRRLNNGK